MSANQESEKPKEETAIPVANDMSAADPSHYTVIIPGSKGVRRSTYAVNDTDYLETYYEDVKTVYDAFRRGLQISNNEDFLGSRQDAESQYKWVTYHEVHDNALHLGSGLLSLGINPGQDTFIGLHSRNRVEWVVSDIACMSQSMVSVPLYDTLGPKACSYIIDEANIQLVICESGKNAHTLLDGNLSKSLKFIVVIDYETDEIEKNSDLVSLAESSGVQIKSFRSLIEIGKNNAKAPQPPEPDNVFTVSYTSGTTGDPKGVVLTHKNLISIVSSVAVLWKQCSNDISLRKEDVAISYLPLAHMFERNLMIMMYAEGGKSGFFRGEVPKLFDDVKALQPTIFPFVPRVLNKIFDKTEAAVRGTWIKAWLLKKAIISKNVQYKKGLMNKNGMWDKVMFRKLRETLGIGALRLAVVGSAPISENILSFARAALGCTILEGYGQTEATTAVTFTLPQDTSLGHVGAVVPSCHVKLVDVPDLKCFAKNDEGEVCVRGSNVCRGYLNNPDKTAEIFDQDGWLHTGDVGRWLPNGNLQIIDRVKHIFKLSQGEYLSPEKIENVYLVCELVSQIFVDGNSLHNYCVAVVVPDVDILRKWSMEQFQLNTEYEELCGDERVCRGILTEMTTIGKQSGLKSFEQVKKIYLHSEPFTGAQGLVTPTLKNKRPALRQYFKSHIDALYKEGQV